MPALKTKIDSAFASLIQLNVGALLVASDALLLSRRDQVVALAARYALPTIYPVREFALAGGLMIYAPDIGGGYHQAGLYVGRILKGAKPADLPVVRPTKCNLFINLRTAKALGLQVPPMLLARADEVIE